MKKRNTPFNWSHAQAFLATAEAGSFSRAAELLGTSQPTISRNIASLENDLGILLFDRIGKSLSLNDTGRALVSHVQIMQESADSISISASGNKQSIAGSISITASDIFCVHILPPILEKLRQTYPDLQVRLIACNTVQDLKRREADIAIRHVQPKHPDLYAKQLKTIPAYLYGAESYLSTLGKIRKIKDLPRNSAFIGDMHGNIQQMLTGLEPTIHQKQFSITTENGLALWEMVKRGLGLSLMLENIAAQTPNVSPILQEEIYTNVPIWLVTHGELKTSAKIRAVFGLLSEEIQKKS